MTSKLGFSQLGRIHLNVKNSYQKIRLKDECFENSLKTNHNLIVNHMQITCRKLNEYHFFVYKVQPLKPVKIGKTYSRAMSTLEKKFFCSHNFFPEGF